MTLKEKRDAGRRLRLGILTGVWGRSTLTGHVMRHYAGLRVPGVDIYPLAVWSLEDTDPPPDVKEWDYVVEDNQPLGRKWNKGVKALVDLHDVDAIMIIGSDDFVSWTYFDLVKKQLLAGSEVISVRDLYVYEPPEDYVLYCESMIPGAGRVLSRSALEALNMKPWDGDAPGYLDSSLMKRMRQIVGLRYYNARDMSGQGFAIVDVKMPEGPNMWKIELNGTAQRGQIVNTETGARLHVRRVTRIPAKQFFKDHFPHIVNFYVLGRSDPYVTPR